MDDVDRWVRAASLPHSDGDARDIAVRDGRIVGVRGRAADRVNRGRLGPNDLFGRQANASADRLTTPLVREGGRLLPCDRDTAMGRIVARSEELLGRRGPGSIGFYPSGQSYLEGYLPSRSWPAPASAPTTSTAHPPVHRHGGRGAEGVLRL